MLKFEIKKILLKPLNKIILIALLLVTIAGGFLAIQDVRYETADGDVLKGIVAAQQYRVKMQEYSGVLDNNMLMKVIEKNQELNKNNSEDEAYRKKQGLNHIRELINLSFSPMKTYDYYTADHISKDEVVNFYANRVDNLKEWLNSEAGQGQLSKNEEAYLMEQFEKLETPFQIQYAKGWEALLDSGFLPTLLLITVVCIGFLVSGIFSDEFKYHAESIFFSTQLGRNKAVLSKIKAGIITTTFVYWAVIILYTLIILIALGFDGANNIIQTCPSYWDSMYNLTYGQTYFIVVIGGYIGTFFILLLAMLISALTHSTVFAITIPFIFSCIPLFLGRISFLSRIITLFPDKLLRINTELDDFLLYDIGGNIFSIYHILFLLYFILCLVCIPLIYQIYKKAEVK